jgi:hypothetical protein
MLANSSQRITDATTYFSTAQALSDGGSGSTVASTNSYDISVANALTDCTLVVEGFTVPATETLDIIIQTDDNSGFSSAKEVMRFGQFAAGTYGRQFLPLTNLNVQERYVRVVYTLSAGCVISGGITSYLTV